MADVRATFREQMQSLLATLKAAVGDCTGETASKKLPGSTINSVGAIYAHTNILPWHVATHQGELSALKGAQGLNGLVLNH